MNKRKEEREGRRIKKERGKKRKVEERKESRRTNRDKGKAAPVLN
jgi:hypothetical protein